MSASTKKKHVINEIMDDVCRIEDHQQLVRILAPRGNHLYEVQTAEQETFLVSMPSKFRNTVWVKTGSFVIVEQIDEGNKVKAEIVKILLRQHIKEMKRNRCWPIAFEAECRNDAEDLPPCSDDEPS